MNLQDGGKITKAEEYIENNKKQVESTVWRCNYHVAARTGWINDPNGLIYWKGQYHVFYQYYPYAPNWGPMHWGHAASRDLAHWRHLPVALAPDDFLGQCFSGCAVSKGEELFLLYTAHMDGRTPKEVQCIAKSTDGLRFEKIEKNPVIAYPPCQGSEDFRDPKAYSENNTWRAVIGSGKDGRGKALLYQSVDLIVWETLGALCEAAPGQGDMWECPNYVSFGDTRCLIVSPMNVPLATGGYQKHGKPIYILGREENNRLRQESSQTADFGSDFYAPQVFYGTGERVLMIGWLDMWGKEMPTSKDGWAGLLTLPRELSLRDGHIYAVPAQELTALRQKQILNVSGHIAKSGINPFPALLGDSLEISLHMVFQDPACKGFTWKVRMAPSSPAAATIEYDVATATLHVYKACTGEKPVSAVRGGLSLERKLSLHVFIDKSSMEIFVNGGQYVLSERIYPEKGSQYYDFQPAEGSILMQEANAWELENCWKE